MSELFYKKKGRRYHPVQVHDPDLFNALPKGHHLLTITAGFRSTRRLINPDYAALVAAGAVAEKAISTELINIFDVMPPADKLTERQVELWNELKESFENSDQLQIYRKSTNEIARRAVKAMVDEAGELLEIPAVKEAWDHFQLVATLAKKQANEN
jgi:hypothetical protein